MQRKIALAALLLGLAAAPVANAQPEASQGFVATVNNLSSGSTVTTLDGADNTLTCAATTIPGVFYCTPSHDPNATPFVIGH
jgi:hypothetical protein